MSYFSDKSGEYKLVIEAQDGLAPPREIALENAEALLHAGVVARLEEDSLHRHQSEAVGDGRRERQGEGRRPRSVDGAAADDESGVEPGLEVDRVREPSEFALQGDLHQQRETGESKQVTDGLADTTWPVFDAGGKYLWFFASTDFGMRSQWLDMTSYDHTETFGLYLAILKKGEPSPLLPESDEDTGMSFAPGRGDMPSGPGPGRGGGGGRGRGGAPSETTPAETTSADTQPSTSTQNQPDRAPRGPVNVQIDFDGLRAAHPRDPRRAGPRVLAG